MITSPKTIIISGARSKVGKTALAMQLRTILVNSVVIKIGHGKRKRNYKNHYYPHGTPLKNIIEEHQKAPWLIIESNSALREIKPHLSVFLEGQPEKPSAPFARERADFISGEVVSEERVGQLARGAGIGLPAMRRIIWLAGARIEPVTAIILTGGENTRMGKDKHSLSVGRATILEGLIDNLLLLFDQVLVSAGKKKPELDREVDWVEDEAWGKGPLMGIFSALKKSENRINFIIACDIPRIHIPTLRDLLSWSCEYDIVMPCFKQGYSEPLFAVYHREVYPLARKLLNRDRRKIAGLFELCRTKTVLVREKDWYFNINTPEEYQRYLDFLNGDQGKEDL